MELQSESIVLVSSCDPNTSEFGTGFVVHSTADTTYVLTSAHLVEKIGKEHLMVSGKPGKVFKASKQEEFDIAVLKVQGLLDRPPLILSKVETEGNPITILGFYKPVSNYEPILRSIRGNITDRGMITTKFDQDRVTNLHLNLDGVHSLKRGYSGSPVLDNFSNHVLGIVRILENDGYQGMAVSIAALKKIWPDAPFNFEEDAVSTSKLTMNRAKTTQVFLFYANGDEKYKDKFESACLSPLEGRDIIKVWSKDKIKPGDNCKQTIEHNLEKSSIFLLLISPKFMRHYYQNIDDLKTYVTRAKYRVGKVKIIPILIVEASWKDEFGDLQPLPRDGRFVRNRPGGQDAALYQIAEELKEEVS
jgi:hypothetical protein